MKKDKKVKTAQDEAKDVKARFVRDFDRRFAGKRVFKTAFHFFNWATGFNSSECQTLCLKFAEYRTRTRARNSWKDAAEWYATGTVGGAVR